MNPVAIYVLSLGCPKNLVDAEVMSASLIADGMKMTEGPEEADIIIVNTCAFILPAREESIEEILRMAQFKKRGTGQCRHLIVTGCLSQRYGRELVKELPEVDLFLGISDIPKLSPYIKVLLGRGAPRLPSVISKPSFLMDASYERRLATPRHMAYLKIADGCSNRCSYCVIPDIRGKARSRMPDDILKEAERLVSGGVKEIILIAQDTTAYGEDLKGKPSLGGLLKDMSSIEKLAWIRVLYTYPARLTEDLFAVMAQTPKVCPYIDMPIQHADDTILGAMHRRGDRRQTAWAIRTARTMIPDVALRTSVIVGFPGETSKRFESLLDFIRESRFDHLGAFVYSREQGTAAALRPSRISEKEKTRRRSMIMEEQAVISYEINQNLIGSCQEVLIEGASDLPDFPYVGRCRRQAPEIDGVTYLRGERIVPGSLMHCRIIEADEYDLYGEVIAGL